MRGDTPEVPETIVPIAPRRMSKVKSQKNQGEQKDFEYYHDSRLIKKVSLDYNVERKRRRTTIKMEKLASLLSYEVKYYLDFDRRLNIPD